jgi:hypothetical protein
MRLRQREKLLIMVASLVLTMLYAEAIGCGICMY